jgi:ribosomal subunit interface protein
MQIPIQVSFRHLEHSPFITSAIRKRARKLEKFFPRITSMRVMVEPSHQKRKQGNLYHVRIDMAVPGKEIIVKRDPGKNHAHEDIYVAIRDAFDSARRQLEDFVRINYQLKTKLHARPMIGKIVRFFPNEDCGFLKTTDGRELYFHRNSVLNKGFERIRLGDEVRYSEEQGEQGPQASTVDRIGKNGRHISIS